MPPRTRRVGRLRKYADETCLLCGWTERLRQKVTKFLHEIWRVLEEHLHLSIDLGLKRG